MLTGRRLNPVLTYPSFGSLLGQAGKTGNPIPSYVAVPDAHPYARQGFLPTMRAPFEVGGRPGSGGTDTLLRNLWHDRMKRGDFFAYNLTRDELDDATVRTEGRWRFIIQLNSKRSVKKRRAVETRWVRPTRTTT